MNAHNRLVVLCALAFGGVLSVVPLACAQEARSADVEVMARGPVHEAFAMPVTRAPQASPVIAKQPPEPIEELPPEQKPEGEHVIWVPGYWFWDDDSEDFFWISGVWRAVPPGRQWMPGYWNRVDDGWQWVAGFWSDQTREDVDYLPPPPQPIAEAVPEAPDTSSNYVAGCWVFHETRYLWRPGYWIAYRPGWVWIPAYYVWTPAGYVFVEGHWDYVFQDRGVLFAPVSIARAVWSRPGWYYQPSYVVYDRFLLNSLFVRSVFSHYYFGDYYAPAYDRLGFSPWTDYQYSRGVYDPNYSYYRWTNRNDPRWDRDLRQTYVARREGTAPPPPRTLSQQVTVQAKAPDKAAIALAPLTKIDTVKLQAVSKTQITEIKKTTTHFREFVKERSQLEVKVVKEKGAPAQRAQEQKAQEPQAPVKVKLATKAPKAPEAKHAPPPAPSLPKPQAHPQPTVAPKAAETPAAKPATKPEPAPAKPGAKPEPKAEPAAKPEPKPAEPAKPAAKPEPKPAEPAPKPAAKPEPKPKPAADPKDKDKDKGKGKEKDKDKDKG